MGKLEKQQKWSVNGVIVTVYQESSITEPRPRPRPRPRKIIRSTTPKSWGYDRRAELLAYAHHLRIVGSQQIIHDHSPTDFSNLPNKPKKRRWFARLKALKFSFGRLFGRDKNKAWKYENVESRDRGNKYRTSPYPRRDRGRGRCSKISKKFSHVMKQFACGNKCSKGFDRYEDQYRDLHNTS